MTFIRCMGIPMSHRKNIDHHTYIIETWFSNEDKGYVAIVNNLGGVDHAVHVSAVGDDKYKAIAEVSEALRSWESSD